VAHKSEKRCPGGSANVNEPRTKRRIANLPNGFRTLLRTATVPTTPTTPNPKRNLELGTLVGLALGFGLALLREVLDTKVRSEADVQKVADASVIARIGYDDDAPQHPLIMQNSPHSHRSEAFRRLRTNLQFLDIADRPKTIVVTSSLPGEGKTTTAINLAITLADAGSRVALVDADLHRPSIADYMGLEGEVGLTTVLIGQADLQDAIQPWGNGNLHVLPSGQVPPNPSELLGSRSMANLLEQLVLGALPGRPFRAENGVVVARRCRRSLVLEAVN
jgi:polysaccharide biosynthesis transport protein